MHAFRGNAEQIVRRSLIPRRILMDGIIQTKRVQEDEL